MSAHLLPSDLKKSINHAITNRPDGTLPYKKNTRKAVRQRDLRASEWPDFQDLRRDVSERRQQDIDRLEELHLQLREKWKKNGIEVHEAKDALEAAATVEAIVRRVGADRILKSKSMLGEEIGLNDYLSQRGIIPVETDLGEFIVQLRGETPSHITMPAMHLDREDVGRLFAEKLGVEYTDDPGELTRIARKVLRKEFLAAKVGLCGVNFAVAATGHLATVTNEGNGRMVTSLPRVVIAIMGWERVTRSLDELALLWQMLSRSATGQRATVYLNLTRGPTLDRIGPEEVHVIVVDNGRKQLWLDEELRSVLRCIRCGACLNVCPVYQQVGGHPYGGTYPGPIGAVLAPTLFGLETAPDHPFASSLCGACEEICPVSIPLPKHLLTLRPRIIAMNANKSDSLVWDGFGAIMKHEEFYRKILKGAGTMQRLLTPGMITSPAWGKGRATPRIATQSFRDWYRENRGEDKTK